MSLWGHSKVILQWSRDTQKNRFINWLVSFLFEFLELQFFIKTIIETFSSCTLAEEILHESGLCQNCFIKFNEYDEHQSIADQIQLELVSLMDSKFVVDPIQMVKDESTDETIEAIEYENYDNEEIFTNDEDILEDVESEVNQGEVDEALEEDFHFEIIVDDSKEDSKNFAQPSSKPRSQSQERDIATVYIGNQKFYQCDICLKTFKVCATK